MTQEMDSIDSSSFEITGKKEMEKIGKWEHYSDSDSAKKISELLGDNFNQYQENRLDDKWFDTKSIYVLSTDLDGKKSPHVVIEMKDGLVGSIFGFDNKREVEDKFIEEARDKCLSLPGGEKFKDTFADMVFLKSVSEKIKNEQELNNDDIKFVYGIDREEVHGFHHSELIDRIYEIRKGRDVKMDLSKYFGCLPEEVGVSASDLREAKKTNRDLKYYYDELGINYNDNGFLKFPTERLIGSLQLNLSSVENIKLPKQVDNIQLYGSWVANSLNGFELPKKTKSMDFSLVESTNVLDLSQCKTDYITIREPTSSNTRDMATDQFFDMGNIIFPEEIKSLNVYDFNAKKTNDMA